MDLQTVIHGSLYNSNLIDPFGANGFLYQPDPINQMNFFFVDFNPELVENKGYKYYEKGEACCGKQRNGMIPPLIYRSQGYKDNHREKHQDNLPAEFILIIYHGLI